MTAEPYDPAVDIDMIGDGRMEPDWQVCPVCKGDCMVTVVRSRPGYLDEDVDADCGTCGGSGRVTA